MGHTFERTRKARLVSLTSNGSLYMSTLARVLECPEASIRRDIQQLRNEGYYITLERKLVTNYGRHRFVATGPPGDYEIYPFPTH